MSVTPTPLRRPESKPGPESNAILKYIAQKQRLSVYPAELRAQARVDEMIGWFSTNFRAYHCILGVYPQMLPALGHLAPQTRADMAGLSAYGSKRHLTFLDANGPASEVLNSPTRVRKETKSQPRLAFLLWGGSVARPRPTQNGSSQEPSDCASAETIPRPSHWDGGPTPARRSSAALVGGAKSPRWA